MALHPDRNEPVVATGQIAGLTHDAKVSSDLLLGLFIGRRNKGLKQVLKQK